MTEKFRTAREPSESRGPRRSGVRIGMQSASKRLFEQAQPLRTEVGEFLQKIRAA